MRHCVKKNLYIFLIFLPFFLKSQQKQFILIDVQNKKEFVKNEMDFLISSLAYNLYHVFQQTILEEKDQTIRMNTYRLKYQKIAVKVIQHARQATLSFSSAYKNKTQFIQYWNKVLQI